MRDAKTLSVRLLPHPARADVAALIVLTFLWALYFWRVLTPDPHNQVSLPEGDFSGQFLAFGAYQARRLLAGEVPLWNPYNNAGHPFLADTQSAVFYPPRVVTILISQFFGGWSYSALQGEALAHYWLSSVWMYLFVRTATRSYFAGIISALTYSYGGYLTGYPPLQLAVLEAGIWLPLGLLGVFQASEARTQMPPRWRGRWLALTALSLGIGLLAGHPQTSLFSIYVLSAYLIYRGVSQRLKWYHTVIALAVTMGLGLGLAAIQLAPGLEYAALTTRTDYAYENLAGGFPFSSLVTIVLPGVFTVWSPLYFGIPALVLIAVALARREPSAWFWAGVAAIALGVSFGGKGIFYRVAYVLGPGFAMFRGQERAAFAIAQSVAILAGLGSASLSERPLLRGRFSLTLLTAPFIAWLFALELVVLERFLPETEFVKRAEFFKLVEASYFLAILMTLSWLVIGRWAVWRYRAWWPAVLVILVVFDLFSITMGTNWEPIPASRRRLIAEYAAPILRDDDLFRIDTEYGFGTRGPGENYATLLGVQDIRGTSPLRLGALEAYLRLPKYRLHQLLAVKYVFISWQQLEVQTTVVAQEPAAVPPIFVHRIEDEAPRAWMVYRVVATPDRDQALAWLAEPNMDPRRTVILEADPPFTLPDLPPANGTVAIREYKPERIHLQVNSPANGILVISEWYYPGWQATVDGEPASIWRANAGLRALPLEAGEHEVVFVYRPVTYYAGFVVTVLSLTILVSAIAIPVVKRSR